MIDEDSEIKLVTRQETFNDLAVRELAKVRAQCICCLQFKRCQESNCTTCKLEERYNNCTSKMNDYDLLRLNNYTSKYYVKFSASPWMYMRHKEYCEHFIKYFFVVMLLVFFICGIGISMMNASEQPAYDYRVGYAHSQAEVSDCTAREIKDTITLIQNSIVDVNGDDLINCIDYATLFYLTYYTFYSKNIDIVQNYHPGVMNHLFVQVRDKGTGKWIEVEPWTPVINNYMIVDCWSYKEYNPKYNLVNTQTWLKQCKQPVYIVERYKK